MALSSKVRGTIVAVLVFIFGIIHFGLGIGIARDYSRYKDIFRQSVALAIYDLIIGIFGTVVGILSIVVITTQRINLYRPAAICSLVLGVLTLGSLITALALNSQAIGYVRSRLTYRMSSFTSIGDSLSVVNDIQTRYECCGENLWLDWAQVVLNPASTNAAGAVSGPGSSNTIITSGSGSTSSLSNSDSGIFGSTSNSGSGIFSSSSQSKTGSRRRRQDWDRGSKTLQQPMHRKRDISVPNSNGNIYNLPSNYSIYLPLSCCTGGGTSSGNSLGGVCTFNAGNGSTNFYVRGCLEPISNTVVSQITGMAVINVCLAILAFVFVLVLMHMIPSENQAQDKNGLYDGTQQTQYQQVQNSGSIMNPAAPSPYYNYSASSFVSPTHDYSNYANPTYTVYQ
ncbi:unnamed protein product [Adineta ricciae]|uniref:Tetraspanin n=1 Tax=Adineta ricciae TaxID=249248 RepID=A0A815YAM7_ADIRI|nr:unnamed protein product [Adineta ricciae]CAF1567674.1 unnamed protein product [Adineta ricciae]